MTKATQYKNTVIGPIPIDWEVKKLGEEYNITMGQSPNSQFYNSEGIGLPLIQGNADIVNGESIIRFYTSQITKTCEKDELIFTVRAPVGEMGIAAYVSCLGRGVCSINHSNSDSLNYIKFYLENYRDNWGKLSQGSTFEAISGKELKQFSFPLPPLPEQQKIAEILSTWDKAIQETDTIIKKLEDRNKGLANKLFEENNWQVKKLSDLFERITDKNKEGNTTVTTISARHGFIRQEDFFNKTVASKDLSNYYLINKGDFCYNKSYSKDYDWGVIKRLNNFEKAVVTTLYICFRFKDDSQNSDFWELYFENKILDKGLSKVAQEGGRAHGLLNVTSGDFFGIKVKVPSLEEQNEIADILNTANQEVKQYQQKLETLKLQKKGLMQQLLTGKVRTA